MARLLLLLGALCALTGCDVISPFVTEQMRENRLDVDNDDIPFTQDCDDSDPDIGRIGWYRDVDEDGYGAGEIEYDCEQPEGYVANQDDCDDTESSVSPEALEQGCNEIDDDCDEQIDEDNFTTWYRDADEDDFGDPDETIAQCDRPSGYVDNGDDCDDTEQSINPDADDICDDGIDQNCNDMIDDAVDASLWYADADMDGYGDPDDAIHSCMDEIEGRVPNDADCDDTNININPEANEACGDGEDNDCDGEVDTDAVDVDWYRDFDEDGYGNIDDTTVDCAPPAGFVGNDGDCNDEDGDVNPEAEEVCNDGVDNNCNDDPDDCTFSGSANLSDADASWDGEEGDELVNEIVARCDLSGDGVLDLVFSGTQAGDSGDGSNAVWVFFGPVFSGSFDVSDADILFSGNSTDSDYSVTCGDLDSDGSDDLVIGSAGDDTGGSGAGAVFIFSGNLAAGQYSPADADYTWLGASAGDRAGHVVRTGYMDADANLDLVVSAYFASDEAGEIYIVEGPLSGDGSFDEAEVILTGETSGERAGYALDVGDLDNDGLDDLAIGAFFSNAGGTESGVVYVLYSPTNSSMSLSDASAIITGSAGERAGISVAIGGDLGTDGINDLVIGAYYNSGSVTQAGAVYIFNSTLSGDYVTTDAAFTIAGTMTAGNAGISVSSHADTNNDGHADLVIGANAETNSSSGDGSAYFFYGPITSSSSTASADMHIEGEASMHGAGAVVLLTEDLSGDGFGELFVCSPGIGSAGRLYWLSGLGY